MALTAESNSDIRTGLLNILSNLQAGRFVTTACLALSIYDYLITLSEEIDLFWDSTWSITKCLFLLNRYTVFVDPLLYMSWTSTAGIFFAQVILKLRTWAVWGKHRLITVLLVAECMIALAIAIVFITKYLEGIDSFPGSVPGGGCIFTFENRQIFADFIFILVSEASVVILLLIKAIQHFRHGDTLLMTCILRDGLLYFLFILATSIANVVTILVAPVEIHATLVTFQRVMHSLLCTRVLLHIRSVLVKHRFHETTFSPLDSSFSITYLPTYNAEQSEIQ
ncbi:hypothetical protein ACEPAG_493 [Sanghuangporus baumii]